MRSHEHSHIRHWVAVADTVAVHIDLAVVDTATDRIDMQAAGVGILLLAAGHLIAGHMVVVVAAAGLATGAVDKAVVTHQVLEARGVDCTVMKEVARLAEDRVVAARGRAVGAQMRPGIQELVAGPLQLDERICSFFDERIFGVRMTRNGDRFDLVRMEGLIEPASWARSKWDDANAGEAKSQ